MKYQALFCMSMSLSGGYQGSVKKTLQFCKVLIVGLHILYTIHKQLLNKSFVS